MLFRSLLDYLRPRPQRARRAAPQPRPCRLSIEALEVRCTPAAVLAIGDVTLVEGNDGTHNAVVQVTLSEPRGKTVTVNYSTADGTALAGSDYNPVSGKLTFARNEMNRTILVPIRGDRVAEPDESFSVRLSNAKGAQIADGLGIVTIADDEPRVSINDVSLPEVNSGATAVTFPVRLSAAYDLPVTVTFATSDGTATAGIDYTAPAGGTLTFLPGHTSQTITVAVNGDLLPEGDETFFVNLSTSNTYAEITKGVGVGTILDNEPRTSVTDAWQNPGEPWITFKVTLSAPCDEVVTVDFATGDSWTAYAGVDYVAASGTLTFAPGETIRTITIELLNPTPAMDKYFYFVLSNSSPNVSFANYYAFGWWYYDGPY